MATENTKHTPGPWTVERTGDGYDVVGNLGFSIPGSGGQDAWVRVAAVSRKAEAHLIAAAPDLLAALEDAELELNRGLLHLPADSQPYLAMRAARNRARATIAKAGGAS